MDSSENSAISGVSAALRPHRLHSTHLVDIGGCYAKAETSLVYEKPVATAYSKASSGSQVR
ncbi:MAG: hypothetical protein WBZ36_05580 [Candidatus Nitrosopolaris sp.]